MEDLSTRTSIINNSGTGYYIGLEIYHSHFDEWYTLKQLSKPYETYEEAERDYTDYERLGYMDPALYSI